MDEHGNGLNEEMIEILDRKSRIRAKTVSTTQQGNNEISIRTTWNFAWPKDKGEVDTLQMMSRTMSAWRRICELHPKGRVQGVHLDVPKGTIAWTEFWTLEQFYESIKSKLSSQDKIN